MRETLLLWAAIVGSSFPGCNCGTGCDRNAIPIPADPTAGDRCQATDADICKGQMGTSLRCQDGKLVPRAPC